MKEPIQYLYSLMGNIFTKFSTHFTGTCGLDLLEIGGCLLGTSMHWVTGVLVMGIFVINGVDGLNYVSTYDLYVYFPIYLFMVHFLFGKDWIEDDRIGRYLFCSLCYNVFYLAYILVKYL